LQTKFISALLFARLGLPEGEKFKCRIFFFYAKG
jgi:hypothetical protein